MRTRILGVAAASLAWAAGAPWWAALLVAALFQPPGRLAPTAGTAGLAISLLPADAGEAWRDALPLVAGILGGWAALLRLAPTVPWVALPYVIGASLALALLWGIIPPAGLWSGSDLAVRARILALAMVLLVAAAPTYLPRYRKVPSPASAGGGTSGARDDTR